MADISREELLSLVPEFMDENFERVSLGSVPAKKVLIEFTKWASNRLGVEIEMLAYQVFYNRLRELEYRVPTMSGKGFGFNTKLFGIKRIKS